MPEPTKTVNVRPLDSVDIGAVVDIDEKISGQYRPDTWESRIGYYLRRDPDAALVAEADGRPVGFIMARVDFGEFGRAEPAAVIDTIGVQPDLGRGGIGSALLSQLLVNLSALQVERVRTSVAWNNFPLLDFLDRSGFAPAQQIVLTKTIDPDPS